MTVRFFVELETASRCRLAAQRLGYHSCLRRRLLNAAWYSLREARELRLRGVTAGGDA